MPAMELQANILLKHLLIVSLFLKFNIGLRSANSNALRSLMMKWVSELEIYLISQHKRKVRMTCKVSKKKWKPFKLTGWQLIANLSFLISTFSITGEVKHPEMQLDLKDIQLSGRKTSTLFWQVRVMLSSHKHKLYWKYLSLRKNLIWQKMDFCQWSMIFQEACLVVALIKETTQEADLNKLHNNRLELSITSSSKNSFQPKFYKVKML